MPQLLVFFLTVEVLGVKNMEICVLTRKSQLLSNHYFFALVFRGSF